MAFLRFRSMISMAIALMFCSEKLVCSNLTK